MSDSKQCSDYAQKGPGLKPAVSTPPRRSAPSFGGGSLGTTPNAAKRGTDNKAK